MLAVPGSAIASGAQPAGNATFTWPYSYGTPSVPAGVGAQGATGLNVPLSSVGPKSLSSVGDTAHVGPANLSNPLAVLDSPTTTLTVTAKNGTTASSVVAVEQEVTLQNITNGSTRYANTSSSGVASFAGVHVGWYILHIYASSASFVEFEQQLWVSTGLSITRYLTPAADSAVAVDNPSSSVGAIWYQTFMYTTWQAEETNYKPPGVSQTQVELWNQTGPGLLATGLAQANGTVEFTNVNKAYTYDLKVIGYETNLTGVKYWYQNTSSGFSVTFGSANVLSLAESAYVTPLGGLSRTTGTIVGTAPPTSGAWNPSVNTTITGGITTISSPFGCTSSCVKITFINALIFWNVSAQVLGSDIELDLVNSTFVALGFETPYAQSVYLASYNHPDNWRITDSTVIGSFDNASWLSTINPTYATFALPFANVTGSLFYGIIDQSWGTPVQTTDWYTYSYDEFLNIGHYVYAASSQYYIGYESTNPGNLPPNLNHVSIFRSYVQAEYNGGNITNTRVNDSKLVDSPPATGSHYVGDYFGPNNTALVFYTSHLNITQSEFGYSSEYGVSVNASSNVNTKNDIEWLDSGPDSFYEDVFTYSHLPSTGVSWYFPQNGTFTDCIFSDALTVAQRAYFGNTAVWHFVINGDNQRYGVQDLYFTSNDHVAHSVFNGTQPFPKGSGIYVNSSYFSGFDWQDLGNTNGLTPLTLWYENDSFGAVYLSVYDAVRSNGNYANNATSASYSSILYGTYADQQVHFDHNTVFTWNGGGLSSADSMAYALYDNFVSVTDNVFYNNQSFGNASQWTDGLTVDLGLVPWETGGTVNVTGNWFLNLDQLTMPFAIANCCDGGGLTPRGTYNVYGNHYFYYPTREANIPVVTDAKAPSRYQGDAPSAATYTTNTSYAFFVNDTPNSGINVQYNSTSQLISPRMGYVNDSYLTNHEFDGFSYYGIAPDVNVTTGTPIVSYRNGLTAGPQRDFYWHGFSYALSVEQSYTSIGANSSRAPPVTLSFSPSWLTPYKEYTVLMYNGTTGSLLATQDYFAARGGFINVTYDPATEPLDPVFALGNLSSAAGGGCGYPCGVAPAPKGPSGFTLTLGFNAGTILGIVALVVGLAVILTERRYWLPGMGLVTIGFVLLILA